MVRIALLTVGRSDFSILRPLVEGLVSASDFEAGLWIGGGHFDPITGETRRDVIASGLPIWAEIPCSVFETQPSATNQAMAEQMQGVASALQVSRPDVVVILGDRFEAVTIGLALVPHNVPIVHISGGSVTEGAIDDVFRHCLTKMAAFHFCDLPAFARRIQAMGENPQHIFTVGALGLDGILRYPRASFEEFSTEFKLPSRFSSGFILSTLHPETRRPEITKSMVDNLLSALQKEATPVIFTYPNADPYSSTIIDAIHSAEGPDFRVVKNLGVRWYYTAMEHAACMVGNSSSGIIEAGSFRLPVINIGDRQKNRYCEDNVIHCSIDKESIRLALAQALNSETRYSLRHFNNPYGDGQAVPRMLEALRTIDWQANQATKAFFNIDTRFTGKPLELD